MINLFLRLFAAHLVADFFLQFDCINKGKYRRGISGFSFLFLHGFIHAIVTYLFLAQWDNWFIPLFIFITHMLTDWAKVVFTNRFCAKPQNGRVVPFLLDQFLHVSFLILVVCCYYWMWGQFPTSKVFFATDSCNKYWLVAISYLLVLKPSGLLIAMFTKRWQDAIHKNDDSRQKAAIGADGQPKTDGSLAQAGAWIGYCERVIALSFILMHNLQGIGFLLAAKSIFRFGNLKEGQETKMTEYVLLGSLFSMAIATIVGIVTSELMFNIC